MTARQRRENLRRLAERLHPIGLIHATAQDLDDWQSETHHRVSLSSVGTYTSHVCAFYSWAYEMGHLDTDPAARLPRPRIPTRQPKPIPRADLEMALSCAVEPVYTWLVLGAYMGLRAGEVARIRREDISEGIVDGERRWFLSGIGKGNKPFRLPIPRGVVPILTPHLRGKSGPLWLNQWGTPLSRVTLSNTVSAFFKRLEMPWTMHNTRHHYGTAIQQRTGDMLQTQILMRHSNLNTTRLYVEPVQRPGVVAMDALSDDLRRSGVLGQVG